MEKFPAKTYNSTNKTPAEDAAFFIKGVTKLFESYTNLVTRLLDLKEGSFLNNHDKTLAIEEAASIYKMACFSSMALDQNFYKLPERDHLQAEKICMDILDDLYEMGLEKDIIKQKELTKAFNKNINTAICYNLEDLVNIALKKACIEDLNIISEALEEYGGDLKKPVYLEKEFNDDALVFLEDELLDDCLYAEECSQNNIKEHLEHEGLNIVNKKWVKKKEPPLFKTHFDEKLILQEVSENLTMIRMKGEEKFSKIEKGIALINEHKKLEQPSIKKSIKDMFCEYEDSDFKSCVKEIIVNSHEMSSDSENPFIRTFIEEENLFSSTGNNRKTIRDARERGFRLK